MNLWYSEHLTLIWQTLIAIPLALSVQIALRSGLFSFASIGFYGIGGYAVGILTLHGWPPMVALLLVCTASVLIGYVISSAVVHLRGLYLGMVTFAFDLILTVVATNGGELTGGALGLIGIPIGVSTLGLVIATCLVLALAHRTERYAVGRSIAGMEASDQLAVSVGVDVRKQKRLIFALSAGLGALSGSLFALAFGTMQPTTAGFSLVILALTMAIIGGTAAWPGAVIGAAIITWLPTFTSYVGSYQNLVYGVVLVAVVMYAPDGILGLLSWIKSKVKNLSGQAFRPPSSDLKGRDVVSEQR